MPKRYLSSSTLLGNLQSIIGLRKWKGKGLIIAGYHLVTDPPIRIDNQWTFKIEGQHRIALADDTENIDLVSASQLQNAQLPARYTCFVIRHESSWTDYGKSDMS
jgi:hypothetical protein